MSLADAVLMEMGQEAPMTRKCLERIPEEHFDWTPHEKSFNLRQQVSHIAEIPTWTAPILDADEMVFDMESYVPYSASSVADLLEHFDQNMEAAKVALQGQSDEHLQALWRMKVQDEVLFEAPRIGVIRGMILNHTYHHRGQLCVYLRLKDVPLPAIYGPSADEGQMM